MGSIYGRFCIKFPQSRMKGERHRQLSAEPLVIIATLKIVYLSTKPPLSAKKMDDINAIDLNTKQIYIYISVTFLLYCYLQGEDKKYKAPSTITGPLLVLEHVVKQPYFPKLSREMLSMFMSR